MGTRRVGREIAVQFLYQNDIKPSQQLETALHDFWELCGTDNAVARQFAENLIRGAMEKLPEVDRKIQEYSQNWDFNRMAAVDRNILRLSVYELLFREDVPPVVCINEAIEIAKHYSTEDSGKFINGILDQVRKELLRPARQAAGNPLNNPDPKPSPQ